MATYLTLHAQIAGLREWDDITGDATDRLATTLTTLLHHLQTAQEDGQDTVTITEIMDLLSDELGEDQV